MSCDLFIFAGEKSGDLHGEKLLESLLLKQPSLNTAGVGGPLMRKHLHSCVLPMEAFQVMGFIDVLLSLPKLIKQFHVVANHILQLNPRVVVLIDYPGFNLRLARHLRKKGFTGKLVHFICPSVWAHGKQRISLMAKNLDLLLCILPFEPALFDHTTLQAVFVGHPLSERIANHVYKPLPFPITKPLISLFPGSRRKEIERNLPLMLAACKCKLDEGTSFQIALSVSEKRFLPLIQKAIQESRISAEAVECVSSDYSYELMRASHLSIAKSGTVTLELAFHRVPTVVIYAVSFLDQFIAYHLLRIRLTFYCLVNIIAKKAVFTELIGSNLTLPRLMDAMNRCLDPAKRIEIDRDCQELLSSLGSKNAAQEASFAILNLFSYPRNSEFA